MVDHETRARHEIAGWKMTADNGSYIKLFRKIRDSRVWGNPNMVAVWMYCLTRANYTKRWVTVRTGRGSIRVEVGPGQFIYGRNVAANEIGISVGCLRGVMVKLKKWQKLTMQTASHYSIITICNWGTYQNDEPDANQPSNQASGQASGQAKATDKKLKKFKKVKKETQLAGFDEFWEAYPNWHNRRNGKDRAKTKWNSLNCHKDAPKIMAALVVLKTSDSWNKDGHKYLPAVNNFLRDKKWDIDLGQVKMWEADGPEPHFHTPSNPVEIQKARDLGLWDDANNCLKEAR